MWERFSYYGMRALLMLYMVAPEDAAGLPFLQVAGTIYAFYTFSVYALSIPGGWMADRFLGYRKAVLVGGILIVLGEFGLASGPVGPLLPRSRRHRFGTGLLKTNCTSLVGMLYEKNDPRRDGGFSIYYMGINIGALIAPLILGFIAQDPAVVNAMGAMGLGSVNGWRVRLRPRRSRDGGRPRAVHAAPGNPGRGGLRAGARVPRKGTPSLRNPSPTKSGSACGWSPS